MKLMEATEQIKVLNETAGGPESGRHKEVRSMQYSTEGYLRKTRAWRGETNNGTGMCTLYAGEHCHRVTLIPSTIVVP